MSTDAELVRRAQAGDGDAWAEIFMAHRGHMLGLAARLMPGSDDAEDVVSEAFLRAMRALPRMDPNAMHLEQWLNRIVLNLVRDRGRHIRYRRRMLGSEDAWDIHFAQQDDAAPDRIASALAAPEEELPEAVLTAAEEQELARHIFAHLPEQTQQVLRLHVDEGLSCEEVGVRLGLGRQAVKSTLYRGNQQAKQMWAAMQDQRLRRLGMWASGMGQRDIAAREKRAPGTIQNALQRTCQRLDIPFSRPAALGWIKRRRLTCLLVPVAQPPQGMQHPGAPLTRREQYVVAQRAAGVPNDVIADELGIWRQNVSLIWQRAGKKQPRPDRPRLTAQRRAVVERWAAGASRAAIADALAIPPYRVSNRLCQALKAMGIVGRDDAAREAARAWLAAHPGARVHRNGPDRYRCQPLNDDDWQCLALTAAGMRQRDAVRRMGKEHAREAIRTRVLRRLGVRTWDEAVAWFRAQQPGMAAD